MKELATIVKVRRVKPGWIHVIFACGEVRSLELRRYARKGTVFESLADPAYASQCRIVDRGHALRWPGGEDFSAGALLRSGSRVEAAPLTLKVKDGALANPPVVTGVHKNILDTKTSSGKKQRVANALKAISFASKTKLAPTLAASEVKGQKARLSMPQLVQFKPEKKKSGNVTEPRQERK